MQPVSRTAKHLLLLGGGHAHISVLRAFGMRPLSGLKITLVSPSARTPYSGMLPGFVAGHYPHEAMHLDLLPLSRFAGADLVLAAATGMDADRQTVSFAERPPLSFDLISIDVGIAPGMGDVRITGKRATPVKPISLFAERFRQLHLRIQSLAARGKKTAIGVVGAGAGGVELCLALAFRFRDLPVSLHLFSEGETLLPGHNRRVQSLLLRLLAKKGIQLHTGFRALALNDTRLVSAAGEQVELEEVLFVTSAAAPLWLQDSGLALSDTGFVQISRTLQSVSHAAVFAAGDVAEMLQDPRPKAGVFAVRQGPVLARNLRCSLLGKKLAAFRPQRRFLSLLATGDRHAVASKGWLALSGTWVWCWKNWIDRRFMARFTRLPEMTPRRRPGERLLVPGLDENQMPCAGCGAKVAGSLLKGVLQELPRRYREDIVTGLEAPDDASVSRLPPGQLLVHSVDSLRAFTGDAFLFGRIATLHALSDLFAMAASPQTATAVVTLPYAAGDISAASLRQLMSGILQELQAHNTALAGGHTAEGPELSLGLAVNGFGSEGSLLLKSGAEPGDRLILTKPLGIGVILAAEMQARARGADFEQAMQVMLLSSQKAAELLQAYGATACTDVTGFGLAGHLLEMLQSGRVGAELLLDAVPFLPGTEALAAAGVASSLLPANLSAGLSVEVPPGLQQDPRYQLLFDPQTSGGLLAAVPDHTAEACLAALQVRGSPDAAVIGQIRADKPGRLQLV